MLVANIVAWFVVVCVQVLTRFGALPLHWSAYFLLFSFWDILYLAILIAVAAIWFPGEESFQYAWYSQSATSEAEAGMDVESGAAGGSHSGAGGNGGGIEMAGLHAASLAGTDDSRAANQGRGGAGPKPTAAPQPGRGPIDDGEDFDGDEIDLERFERVERQAPQAAFSIGADDEEDGAHAAASGHGAPATSATVAAPRAAAAASSTSVAGGGLAAQHDQAAIDDAVVVLDVEGGADAPAAASAGDDAATAAAGASVPSSPVPSSRVPRLAPPKGDAGAPPGASL